MVSPFVAIFWVWDVWFASWMIAAVWAAPAARRVSLKDQVPYWAITALGLYLLLVIPVRAQAYPGHLWVMTDAAAWVMVALAALGLGFCWWARLHLGPLWSGSVTRKAGHHIVDTGPYGLVRHPIYTGLILAAWASALLRGTLHCLVGAGLFTLGFWLKARIEEQFLRQELGAPAYDDYARRVPMLIPRLGAPHPGPPA
jgi:protein-S-isoprenylcysteine O-methyltransferase Ste14